MSEEGLSPDQYIRDEYFQRWVYEGDPDATLYWEEFLRNNPHQQAAISEARMFLLVFGDVNEVIEDERITGLSLRIDKEVDVREGIAITPAPSPLMQIHDEKGILQTSPPTWKTRIASILSQWFKR